MNNHRNHANETRLSPEQIDWHIGSALQLRSEAVAGSVLALLASVRRESRELFALLRNASRTAAH